MLSVKLGAPTACMPPHDVQQASKQVLPTEGTAMRITIPMNFDITHSDLLAKLTASPKACRLAACPDDLASHELGLNLRRPPPCAPSDPPAGGEL